MTSIYQIRVFVLAFLFALAGTGCKRECPPAAGGGGACPAPVPKKGPLNVPGILDGFDNGGTGKGTFTVPVLGDIGVKLDCSEVKVKKDKPEAGQTQVDMKCTFKKLGLKGNADITLIVDKDGKGSIAVTGSADLIVDTQDINVWVDLNGGSQTDNTITVNATANGQCFTATLKRDGDKLIIEVDNPKTKVEINKR